MEFVLIPKEASGDDKKFEGNVTLKVLSVPQKMRLMSKINIEIGEDGVAKKDMKQLAAIADIIDEVKPFVIGVNLKNIGSGKEYKSFSDLEYSDECMNILMEIASKFMTGFNLGNA